MGIRRRFGQYWSEFCQKMSNNFRSSDSDFFDVAAAGAAILNGRKSHFSTAVYTGIPVISRLELYSEYNDTSSVHLPCVAVHINLADPLR